MSTSIVTIQLKSYEINISQPCVSEKYHLCFCKIHPLQTFSPPRKYKWMIHKMWETCFMKSTIPTSLLKATTNKPGPTNVTLF